MLPSYIIPFIEYDFEERTIMTCVSYEDRSVLSLERLLNKNKFDKCIVIKLTDLLTDENKWDYFTISESDSNVRDAWIKNYEKIKKMLEKWNVERIEVTGTSSYPDSLAKKINYILPSNEKILLDISAFPKHILMSILRWNEGKSFTYLYTRPKVEREAETEFSVGTKEIGVLRGFEGDVRLDRNDFIVMILGFEGSRALSIFRNFEPYRTLALLGNPAPFLDKEKCQFYRNNAFRNNSQLLSNQRVIKSQISSLDPYIFKQELNAEISKHIEKEEANILITCLGTKPQTLGLYLYWLENRNTQIIYTIPSKRRISSESINQILVYNLKENKT